MHSVQGAGEIVQRAELNVQDAPQCGRDVFVLDTCKEEEPHGACTARILRIADIKHTFVDYAQWAGSKCLTIWSLGLNLKKKKKNYVNMWACFHLIFKLLDFSSLSRRKQVRGEIREATYGSQS